ncbi:MAG: PQQ-binding-like beta-propeller repeat protein, partial [Acidobacteriota bacterium]
GGRRALLEKVWEVPAEGNIIDGPLALADGLFYAVKEGVVRSLSPDDGHTLWRHRFDREISLAPTGLAGRLFVVVGDGLSALHMGGGSTLWSTSLPSPPLFSPLPTGPRLVVLMKGGRLLTLDQVSGSPLWNMNLPCEPSSPPGGDGNLLVIGCSQGDVLGIESAGGRLLWKRRTSGRIRAQPIIHDHRIVLGNDAGQIIALGTRHGHRKYTAHVAADPVTPLLDHGRLVLVGALDNLLYGFLRRTGHLRWKVDLQARALAAPALKETVAVNAPPLSSGMVVVDTRDGAVLARRPLPGEGRISAAGPVFAGSVLVLSSRPAGGGPGWLTGLSLEVQILAKPPEMVSLSRPGSSRVRLALLRPAVPHHPDAPDGVSPPACGSSTTAANGAAPESSG